MPRSGDRARRLLQQAALELYRERGFDQTTTAEIAAHAGVTERTFFRHFGDKREVLFDGDTLLHDTLLQGLPLGHAARPPLQILLAAFRSAVPMLIDNRPFSEPRHHIINASDTLRERELLKLDRLAEILADALCERGVARQRASLAAHVAVIAFEQAFSAWIDDPATGLDAHIVSMFDAVRDLASHRRASRASAAR
jgi:AcrR family transcriptional regulator